MFKYYNANEKDKFVNDCVVRAISVAENKTWSETYDELSILAKEQGILLDDVDFVEPLLDKRYERTCEKNKTVLDFVLEHDKGTYLITMPNHITVLKEGYVIDTFNCLHRHMWCAWKVE